MTHASLFSGVGGFELASHWAGWTNLFNCEINPFCQTVLKYHFPNATQYSDIKTTDFTIWRGKVDVLTGGFPCQPFSVAGKRKGADDNRYLWPEMLRAIREIRPTWVIGENVNGIASMVFPGETVNVEEEADLFAQSGKIIETEEFRFVLNRICEDFEQEGYSVQPIVIPACAVEAPHRRDRVWFIAHSSDTGIKAVREWQDGVWGLGSIANTENVRWSGWSGESERENDNTSQRRDVYSGVEGFSGERIITDSTSQQSQRLQSQQREVGESQQGQLRGGYSADYSPNYWQNFPTQSPVCRGDDGISEWLDPNAVFAGVKRSKRSKAFTRWRAEAIKAYGNAIVPQVAYQIFNAINQITKQR